MKNGNNSSAWQIVKGIHTYSLDPPPHLAILAGSDYIIAAHEIQYVRACILFLARFMIPDF